MGVKNLLITVYGFIYLLGPYQGEYNLPIGLYISPFIYTYIQTYIHLATKYVDTAGDLWQQSPKEYAPLVDKIHG